VWDESHWKTSATWLESASHSLYQCACHIRLQDCLAPVIRTLQFQTLPPPSGKAWYLVRFVHKKLLVSPSLFSLFSSYIFLPLQLSFSRSMIHRQCYCMATYSVSHYHQCCYYYQSNRMGIWIRICFRFITLGIKHLSVYAPYPFTSRDGRHPPSRFSTLVHYALLL